MQTLLRSSDAYRNEWTWAGAKRGEHENESRTKSEAWLILSAPSRISLASFPVKNAETNYASFSSYLPSNAISDIEIK